MKNNNYRRVRVAVLPRPAGKIIFFLGLLVMLTPVLPALAAEEKPVPMVEKHIFSPDSESSAVKSLGPRSEAASKLEKELIFTGIISTPNGKWAIIRPAKQRKREDGPWRFKVGEEVNGHRIKEIGPNYVVLMKNDKPIRLALYRGGKKRPAPPPAFSPPPVTPPGSRTPAGRSGRSGRVPTGGKPAIGGKGKTITSHRPGRPPSARSTAGSRSQPTTGQKKAVPFAELFKRAQQNNKNGGTPVNPFTRMIQQQNNK